MAWTLAKLAALEDAMQRGVVSVRDGENVVTYASLDAMRRAYEYGLKQVEAAAPGTTTRPRRSGLIRLTQTGTGL